jgi:hypothetical protein
MVGARVAPASRGGFVPVAATGSEGCVTATLCLNVASPGDGPELRLSLSQAQSDPL